MDKIYSLNNYSIKERKKIIEDYIQPRKVSVKELLEKDLLNN